MPKRQHDTEIWKEDWFIDMNPDHRQLFLYIKDQCDCAGIWRVNIKAYERTFKTQIREEDFLREVNLDRKPNEQRVVRLDSTRWLLSGFIVFQYGDTLNPKNQAHKGAIRRILENRVTLSLLKGIKNPQVFDIKYVAKDKSILTLSPEETEDQFNTDNQHNVGNGELSFEENEAPLKPLADKPLDSPYQGLKDKDKDKEYYSIKGDITNVNKDQQNYFLEEKTVQLLYSVPVFQMPEINFFFDGSPFHMEIEKFLKMNFQPFVMNNKLTKDPKILKGILEDFIKHIQERNEYQLANEMMKHFSNWYRKKGNTYTSGNVTVPSSVPPKEITSNTRRDYSNVNGWGRK